MQYLVEFTYHKILTIHAGHHAQGGTWPKFVQGCAHEKDLFTGLQKFCLQMVTDTRKNR